MRDIEWKSLIGLVLFPLCCLLILSAFCIRLAAQGQRKERPPSFITADIAERESGNGHRALKFNRAGMLEWSTNDWNWHPVSWVTNGEMICFQKFDTNGARRIYRLR